MIAENLLAAAELLRERAGAVVRDLDTNPYWPNLPDAESYAAGVKGGLGGPAGEFAAVLTPIVAFEIARLLEAAAERGAARPAYMQGSVYVGAYAVADAVLNGADDA